MYSKHAKCMLMENCPHADFEVCFYNGRLESVDGSLINDTAVGQKLLST